MRNEYQPHQLTWIKARRAIVILAMISLVLCLSPAAVDACPTCKQAVAEGANHEGLMQGYFWSILFMMSMPFLIFGALCSYFYWQVLKARGSGTQTINPAVAAERLPQEVTA